MRHDKKNMLLILSSPSGAGKTTITKKIQQKYQSFKISVSHTTRKPRSNEVNGVDYHFISKNHFKELVDSSTLKEEVIAEPKALLMILLLSNFTIEVSFNVNVD